MKLKIVHRTQYSYSEPVFFEPHQFRFFPRQDGTLSIRNVSITISPLPALESFHLDEENNFVQSAWFEEMHSEMKILAEMEVETLRSNPFDFIEGGDLFPKRSPMNFYLLSQQSYLPQKTFADSCVNHQETQVNKLIQLCEAIYKKIKLVHREDGAAQTPLETIDLECGACRDLAVLFIECSKRLGIPSRFVSGYCATPDEDGEFHLHAWAECFISGGGWRGFDPSAGLAVNDRYIPIAASFDPKLTAPVLGTVRGSAQLLSFTTKIEVSNLD